MQKWKQVVAALLLTVFLIGMGLVNGAQLFVGSSESQIGQPEIDLAAAGRLPEIRIKKAQRNDQGDLIGCWGTGNGCVIVVMTVFGEQHELLITAQDVVLR